MESPPFGPLSHPFPQSVSVSLSAILRAHRVRSARIDRLHTQTDAAMTAILSYHEHGHKVSGVPSGPDAANGLELHHPVRSGKIFAPSHPEIVRAICHPRLLAGR